MSAEIRDAQKMAVKASLAVDSTTNFSAPPTCPLYHGPTLYMLMPAHALAAVPASLPSEFALTPAPASEWIAAFSCPIRAHAGRGPPASNPS
jgi:hypothetical protein